MGLLRAMVALAATTTAAAAAPATSIKPGVFWHDTDGNVLDAHGAGLLEHAGTFYWYGSRRTMDATGTQMDGGIALYSSTDLYSWKFESVILRPFNCTSPDGSGSASASPSGSATGPEDVGVRHADDYPPPNCSNGNGLDLERPKVVQCGSSGKFVMWVRGTGYGNTVSTFRRLIDPSSLAIRRCL